MTYASRGIPEDAYVKLGHSFQMQSNMEAARGSYQNAIAAAGDRQSPGKAEAVFRLGTMSDDDQAQLEATVNAIAIDPNNAQFYYHLGNIMFSRGKQFSAALQAFSKAYELDPTLDHAFGE
jgi:tetratricopeptide (TPR) repeat protein